jgi:hypothetical protein
LTGHAAIRPVLGRVVTKSRRPELASDPRFSSATARYDNRRACVKELDALFASKSFNEWRTVLAEVEGMSLLRIEVGEHNAGDINVIVGARSIIVGQD